MLLSRFPCGKTLKTPRRGWQGNPFDEAIQPDQVKHPDTVLLFRVGDFYETFGADAVAAAKVLNIVLTKRGNGSASEVELAGFPHHSLDTYLPKLVKSGLKVAVCDQLEDPKQAKGLVKRGVTELVTPGLVMHDHVLESKANHYVAAIHWTSKAVGLALLDLSTGEFKPLKEPRAGSTASFEASSPRSGSSTANVKETYAPCLGTT